MARSRSRLTAEIDFDRDGKQHGFIRLPYSVWLNRIQRFLYDVCDPFLRLFRKVIPPVGPLDLSPMVAVITLYAIDQIVSLLLGRLH